jgi:hypothetical protein
VRGQVTLFHPGREVPGTLTNGGHFVDTLLEEVPFSRAHSAAVITPVVRLPGKPVANEGILACLRPPFRVFAQARFLGVVAPRLGQGP